MPADEPLSLSVSVRDLAPLRAACLDCRATQGSDFSQSIGAGFQYVEAWLLARGHDPREELLLFVGAFSAAGAPPSLYTCCIQTPDGMAGDSVGVEIRDLPGGRYAVLSMVKDPAVIGPSIGRFYQEFVPQHDLAIDGERPTYEIYFESTMEYCVPIR